MLFSPQWPQEGRREGLKAPASLGARCTRRARSAQGRPRGGVPGGRRAGGGGQSGSRQLSPRNPSGQHPPTSSVLEDRSPESDQTLPPKPKPTRGLLSEGVVPAERPRRPKNWKQSPRPPGKAALGRTGAAAPCVPTFPKVQPLPQHLET